MKNKTKITRKYQKGGKQKRKLLRVLKKDNIHYWKCVKQNENTQKCNTKSKH